MQTFQSKSQTITLNKDLPVSFLPELFEALKAEARTREIKPEKHTPITPEYSLRVICDLPGCKKTSFFYNPGHMETSLYFGGGGIEIVAGTAEPDSATGVGKTVLATLNNDGYNLKLDVKQVDNLVVNPSVLVEFIKTYSSN